MPTSHSDSEWTLALKLNLTIFSVKVSWKLIWDMQLKKLLKFDHWSQRESTIVIRCFGFIARKHLCCIQFRMKLCYNLALIQCRKSMNPFLLMVWTFLATKMPKHVFRIDQRHTPPTYVIFFFLQDQFFLEFELVKTLCVLNRIGHSWLFMDSKDAISFYSRLQVVHILNASLIDFYQPKLVLTSETTSISNWTDQNLPNTKSNL